MTALRLVAMCAVAVLCVSAEARGQGDTTRVPPPRGRPPLLNPGRGRNPGGPGGQGLNRAQLQRQIRQQFTQRAREVVGLTDDQIARLKPLNDKYDLQRNQLRAQEAASRMGMRIELNKGDAADPAKVDQFAAQLQQARRQQLDVDEAERKDLTTVMTPLQTAKYLNLREQFTQRVMQLQAQRGQPGAATRGEPPPGGPPPASE